MVNLFQNNNPQLTYQSSSNNTSNNSSNHKNTISYISGTLNTENTNINACNSSKQNINIINDNNVKYIHTINAVNNNNDSYYTQSSYKKNISGKLFGIQINIFQKNRYISSEISLLDSGSLYSLITYKKSWK